MQEAPPLLAGLSLLRTLEKRSAKGLVSIFGDNRSGHRGVELVAGADLRAVFGEVVLQVSASPTEERPGVEVGGINGRGAEISIAILRPDRPVIGDGIF